MDKPARNIHSPVTDYDEIKDLYNQVLAFSSPGRGDRFFKEVLLRILGYLHTDSEDESIDVVTAPVLVDPHNTRGQSTQGIAQGPDAREAILASQVETLVKKNASEVIGIIEQGDLPKDLLKALWEADERKTVRDAVEEAVGEEVLE